MQCKINGKSGDMCIIFYNNAKQNLNTTRNADEMTKLKCSCIIQLCTSSSVGVSCKLRMLYLSTRMT